MISTCNGHLWKDRPAISIAATESSSVAAQHSRSCSLVSKQNRNPATSPSRREGNIAVHVYVSHYTRLVRRMPRGLECPECDRRSARAFCGITGAMARRNITQYQ